MDRTHRSWSPGRWRGLAWAAALAAGVLVTLTACGIDELPVNTGGATPDETSGEAAPTDDVGEGATETESEPLGRPAPSSSSSEDVGAPIVSSREEVLIAAFEAQIARLNALDRAGYIARFIDDCGDPEVAGAFSYDFASPTVEVAGAVSTEFESIAFLDGADRARVNYVADIFSDIWVAKDGEWWISTCPE